jgi:hypothetical protein
MGYTHYFTHHRPSLSVKDWTTLCNAVRLLVTNLPEHSTSAGGYHASDPLKLDGDTKIDKEHIAFNGDGALAHETFVLDRSWRKALKQDIAWAKKTPGQEHMVRYYEDDLKERTHFQCCKTDRKPYDLLVCAVLAVAHHLAPDWLVITSDGDRDEWADAVAWASKVTGYDLDIPMPTEAGEAEVDGTVQVRDDGVAK